MLDLARWAPSADNTQPWRFRLQGGNEIDVLYCPPSYLDIFNLDHFAGYMAIGGLIESLDIAASAHGWEMSIFPYETDMLNFRIRFNAANRRPSILIPYLRSRVTQRRALSLYRLTEGEKRVLEESVENFYSTIWIEDWLAKTRLAWLLGLGDKIRLTIPETYQVHRETVAWGVNFSENGIPDAALAVDPLLLRLMRWAMVSPSRVTMLNRYFLGHKLPRLEMDIIPALRCGAHCLLVANQPPRNFQESVAAGRFMQKFWLTAESLRLQTQPEMAPLIFSRYVAQDKRFTVAENGWSQAKLLKQKFSFFFGEEKWGRAAFMMRLGKGKRPLARSDRRSLADLIISKSD